jgi:hypothetical protein
MLGLNFSRDLKAIEAAGLEFRRNGKAATGVLHRPSVFSAEQLSA